MFSLLIIGIVPAILWIWLFSISHRYQRISIRLLTVLFFGGACSGLVALMMNHTIEKYTLLWPHAAEIVQVFEYSIPMYQFGFWMMVGFNEEFAKLLILLIVIYPRTYLQEKFDGVLFAATVSLGFATIENLFYLEQYGATILVVRSVVTLPVHTFLSVPMGYYLAISRLQANEIPPPFFQYPVITILKGWFISATLHGLYDLFITSGFDELAYGIIGCLMLVTLWLSRKSMQTSPFRVVPSNTN